jgi:hypothetical protein
MKVAVANSGYTGGLAQVQFHPSKPLVRVVVQGEEGAPNKTYTINKEDCPATVREGTFMVSLSADGKKMYGIRPVNGVFKLRFKEFPSKKDTDPAPVTKEAKGQKGTFSYQTFTAVFTIEEGTFKGMEVPGYFSYNFEETTEDIPGRGPQSVAQISHPRSQFTKTLIDFLTVTGLIQKTIPWKENLLPLLQRMILKENRSFSGGVKQGRVDSFFEDAG